MDELELTSRLREEVPLGSADRAEHDFLTSIRGRGARSVPRHGLALRLRLRAVTAEPRTLVAFPMITSLLRWY